MEKLKDCCWSIMAFVAISVSILTICLLYVLSLNGILTVSLYARCFRFRRTHGGDDESLIGTANGQVCTAVHKNGVKGPLAQFMQICRSREVGQSCTTSVWTTLLAIVHALWLMIRIRPQVFIGIREYS